MYLHTTYILTYVLTYYLYTDICTYIGSVSYSIVDAAEFEWESQLKFYWVKEPDDLYVRQCTGEFGYG